MLSGFGLDFPFELIDHFFLIFLAPFFLFGFFEPLSFDFIDFFFPGFEVFRSIIFKWFSKGYLPHVEFFAGCVYIVTSESIGCF